MHLKELRMKNFCKFTDFKVEFHDKVTTLVGMNGSGKTTVGRTSLLATIKGIAENNRNGQLIGERFRFIGNGKATADLELTLFDKEKDIEIKISNKISKSGNKITFEAPEGHVIDEEWLDSLLSVSLMSADNFCKMSPKEQALEFGIDTSTHDAKIKEIKDEARLKRSKVKDIGTIKEVAYAERVDVGKLDREKDKIKEFNAAQNDAEQAIYKGKGSVMGCENDIKDAELALETAKQALMVTKNDLEKLPDPKPYKELTAVQQQIDEADGVNKAANAYEKYKDTMLDREFAEAKLKIVTEKQKAAEGDRLEYIKKCDIGFSGIALSKDKEWAVSIGEDGGLLLDDRPINLTYFSRGELEVIVAKLHKAKKSTLMVRFIDNFELLDEGNQEKILKELIDAGFQVIVSMVGSQQKGANCIMLTECKVGKEKKDKKFI